MPWRGIDVDLVAASRLIPAPGLRRWKLLMSVVFRCSGRCIAILFCLAGEGPVRDHAPCGFWCGQVEFLLVLLVAEGVDAHLCAGGVEIRHHDLLAPQGRQGVDAKVDGLFDTRILIRPSCGLRRSEISRPAITLETSRDTTGPTDRPWPLRGACRRYGSAPGRSSRRARSAGRKSRP